MSPSTIKLFMSSCDMRSGSLRPLKGEICQPVFPSYAWICAMLWTMNSSRTLPGRLFSCRNSARNEPSLNFTVVRKVRMAFSFSSPPRAWIFCTMISSTVSARAPAPISANAASPGRRTRQASTNFAPTAARMSVFMRSSKKVAAHPALKWKDSDYTLVNKDATRTT